MSSGLRPALRERSVLAMGLVSAAVLVGVALAPTSDPELAGRAALARVSAEVGDAVVAEWKRMLREPEAPAQPTGFSLEKDARSEVAFDWAAPRELAPSASGPISAFTALFAESERAELAGDLEGAYSLVVEALAKTDDPRVHPEARLRAIQLAAASGAADEVARHLSLAREELAPDLARDGVSWLLLCALAAGPALEEDLRARALGAVRELWVSGALALPGWDARLGGELDLPPDPLRDALARGLGVELGEPDFPQVDRDLRRRVALRDRVGRWGDSLPLEWQFRPLEGAFFVWRPVDGRRMRGAFVTAEGLRARLAERSRETGVLPAGFELDLGGGAPGEAVRPRTALLGDQLGFVLRHRDPQSIVRAESRRMGLIRGALLLMALFAVGAGVSTFRALRRERALAGLKTSFVANVSHELRTPVASILLMAENLEAGRAPDEAAERRYHGLIRREAMRLRRLVDDVLDFSRLERGRGLDLAYEATELEGWLADLGAEAEDWAGRAGVELELELDAARGPATLDREALRRAAFNLLDNAAKYGAGAPVRLHARAADGHLLLEVADRGPGVPARRRGEVFRPFERLGASAGEGNGHAAGTGLGLAIVREIAEAHGGAADVRERDGGGAVFTVRVPLLREDTEVTV